MARITPRETVPRATVPRATVPRKRRATRATFLPRPPRRSQQNINFSGRSVGLKFVKFLADRPSPSALCASGENSFGFACVAPSCCFN
eukprot:4399970-Pleurochrysis_carterae.AAC.1